MVIKAWFLFWLTVKCELWVQLNMLQIDSRTLEESEATVNKIKCIISDQVVCGASTVGNSPVSAHKTFSKEFFREPSLGL